jgi:hypothetical protein
MSLTPDKSNPTHSPPPPDPGVNQGERPPIGGSLLRSQPGEPVSDKVRRAAFWILIFAALGAITAGVTAASGRNDVPDVTGTSVTVTAH